MKKALALVLALCMVVALCACGKSEAPAEDINAKSEGVMTYAEFAAAALDSEVVIEAYVQDTQTWWDGTASIYAQDGEGGYFVYGAACTEEEYGKLVAGQKIRVTGYKTEWAGEVEIADATFEILEGNYVAPAVDVTDKLDALESYMNQRVAFKGMTVEAVSFKNNEPGDDIYVTLSKDGTSYEFCIEAYCASTVPGTPVYDAVGALEAGQTVDVEGFLYWYEGPDTHITAVTVK